MDQSSHRKPRLPTTNFSTIWLIAGSVVVGAGTLLAPPASAQEPLRGQTIFERPRPDYDAKGLNLGGFDLFPFVTVAGVYDDNIFATDDDTEGDFFTRIRAGASLNSRWSRHRLSISGYGQLNRYFDITTENTEEWGADARGVLDVTSRDVLFGGISYDRRTIDRSDPEESGDPDPDQVDQYRANAGYRHDFNRLFFTLSGRFGREDYVESADNFKDFDFYTANLRVGYTFSPALAGFVEPFYSIRDYDVEQPLDRDADGYGGFVGASYDITDVITGETSIGAYRVTFEDPNFSDDSGVAVRSLTDWNVTEVTSLTAELFQGNVFSSVLGASSRVRSLIDLGVQHELRTNLLLGGNFAYIRDDFLDVDRIDDNYNARVEVRYLLNRYFSVSANYDFRIRNSDAPNVDFTRNRVFIAVRGQL